MFDTEIYRNRRKQLVRHLSGQSGLLVFVGNELCPMNYTDNTFPFRQDSSFLYYFGLDMPSLAAMIDMDQGTETLYGNDFTVEEIVWMGLQPSIAQNAQLCGVSNAAGIEQFHRTLQTAQQQQRTIHLLPQYLPQNRITLAEILNIPVHAIDEYISEPFARAVIAMRSVKTDEEIEQIEQALDISGQMHCTAMKMIRPGLTENQVVAAMEEVVTAHSCKMAFPVIFTRHGEILHNHFSSNLLKAGDLVINDSGVETAMHYASDITRTIPVGGRFTPLQKEIYELVLNALNCSIDLVAPGVEFKKIHLEACRILTEGLKEIGLMKGDSSEAVEQGAHAMFFPCGLGHMMGLDVHDMEGLNEDWVGYTDQIHRSDQFGLCSLRLAKALEPGFVLTVEPGIYFIPQLIEQWQVQNKFTDFICYDKVRKYIDFSGIRIEDNVLVTQEGVRLLSGDIPKTCEQVESLALGQ